MDNSSPTDSAMDLSAIEKRGHHWGSIERAFGGSLPLRWKLIDYDSPLVFVTTPAFHKAEVEVKFFTNCPTRLQAKGDLTIQHPNLPMDHSLREAKP